MTANVIVELKRRAQESEAVETVPHLSLLGLARAWDQVLDAAAPRGSLARMTPTTEPVARKLLKVVNSRQISDFMLLVFLAYVKASSLTYCDTAGSDVPRVLCTLAWTLYGRHNTASGSNGISELAATMSEIGVQPMVGALLDGDNLGPEVTSRIVAHAVGALRHAGKDDAASTRTMLRVFATGRGDHNQPYAARLAATRVLTALLVAAAAAPGVNPALVDPGLPEAVIRLWRALRTEVPAWLCRTLSFLPLSTSLKRLHCGSDADLFGMIEAGALELMAVELSSSHLCENVVTGACASPAAAVDYLS